MLRTEMAFYVGCLNLEERLRGKGEPISFPAPSAPGERRLSFTGLYDVCLSLGITQRVVGNDADADGKQLVVITGANQGGKSTFLRSVGLAQLMMQSGMFVAAGSFRANVCEGVFTHFNREEDAAMKSGKLDEELSRMSAIVARLPDAVQRVLRGDERKGGLRDCRPDRRRLPGARHEGSLRHAYVRAGTAVQREKDGRGALPAGGKRR
jgi:hypothetical protein